MSKRRTAIKRFKVQEEREFMRGKIAGNHYFLGYTTSGNNDEVFYPNNIDYNNLPLGVIKKLTRNELNKITYQRLNFSLELQDILVQILNTLVKSFNLKPSHSDLFELFKFVTFVIPTKEYFAVNEDYLDLELHLEFHGNKGNKYELVITQTAFTSEMLQEKIHEDDEISDLYNIIKNYFIINKDGRFNVEMKHSQNGIVQKSFSNNSVDPFFSIPNTIINFIPKDDVIEYNNKYNSLNKIVNDIEEMFINTILLFYKVFTFTEIDIANFSKMISKRKVMEINTEGNMTIEAKFNNEDISPLYNYGNGKNICKIISAIEDQVIGGGFYRIPKEDYKIYHMEITVSEYKFMERNGFDVKIKLFQKENAGIFVDIHKMDLYMDFEDIVKMFREDDFSYSIGSNKYTVGEKLENKNLTEIVKFLFTPLAIYTPEEEVTIEVYGQL